MSIATRVVGDGLVTTTHALIAMSAERGGAASGNGVEHLDLRPGQRGTITLTKSVACHANDIGQLERWTTHGLVLPFRAKRELVEGIDGRMQMALRQMQINGGVFQSLVPHQ